MLLIVEALGRCVFDSSVHPLDLTICPRVVGLRQSMLDTICVTDHVEAHGAGRGLVSVARLICELDPIISEYGVDPVGHSLEKVLEELPRGFPIGFVDQLGHRELTGSVNTHKEIQLTLRRLHLCYIDVEETDRVALKLLPLGLIAADILQPRNPVALQTPMKCRSAEMRDAGLEGIVTRQYANGRWLSLSRVRLSADHRSREICQGGEKLGFIRFASGRDAA